ncbi:hypothetical protein CsatB_023196 [Cannabis sativa]
MEKKIKSINEVGDGRKKWTAKVLVCNKFPPRMSSRSKSRFQHMILIDAQETHIQDALFDDVIERYKNTLIMHKSYYISNAHVKKMDPRYNYLKNKYEWILNRSTVVEEVKEQEDKDAIPSPPAFSFIAFTSLQQYMDSSTRVDIIAVAANIQPARTIQTPHEATRIQEIYLINDENVIG